MTLRRIFVFILSKLHGLSNNPKNKVLSNEASGLVGRGNLVTIELVELTLTNLDSGRIVAYEDALLLAEFHKVVSHYP